MKAHQKCASIVRTLVWSTIGRVPQRRRHSLMILYPRTVLFNPPDSSCFMPTSLRYRFLGDDCFANDWITHALSRTGWDIGSINTCRNSSSRPFSFSLVSRFVCKINNCTPNIIRCLPCLNRERHDYDDLIFYERVNVGVRHFKNARLGRAHFFWNAKSRVL